MPNNKPQPPQPPEPSSPSQPPYLPPLVTARQVLGKWPVWAFPSVLVTLVTFLLALLYSGGIADPQGSAHHLPVALVNQDRGPIGAQFVRGIADAPDPHHRVAWKILSPAAAKDRFNIGRLYGAIVVPADFTASLTAIIRPGAPVNTVRPHVTLLTNQAAGSLASSLAAGIEQVVVPAAARQTGLQLRKQLTATGARPTAPQEMLLADPVATVTAPGHAIGQRTGLGLSAFYLTLVIVLGGFLGATIINNGVDGALGYAPSEFGPVRRERAPLHITRTHTLAVKMVMSTVLATVTASGMVLATAVIIDLDLPHLFLLWVFAVCAGAVVGLGVQAIMAIFGGLGQIVSMFFFVALALPSAGATIPLEAVSGFFRGLAWFEPMRQITGGVRAIIYFDARGGAGLERAWLWLCIGLVVALVLGFGITAIYDRRGLDRVPPDQLVRPSA
ncbi:YhgE/Pip domain-containing protein [Streptomyces sp. NBC_01497]|uniref:YhgE/Pip domain-containing protein n=1 Tax=Streptomyces sp. NBC_01497 TaxID=2903885 RepID=UPI002E2F7807|nr:DUF3533 domain-containing protein [Streptomyces sp. NBC_01497]